jgi:MOSC domain-containing protein YiiM
MVGGPPERPPDAEGQMVSVHISARHTMNKAAVDSVSLKEGLGIEGDAHLGATVQHRSRVRQDPSQPNLRQVHLLHVELHDELRAAGFSVTPGQMGENLLIRSLDLLTCRSTPRSCSVTTRSSA